AGNQRTDALFYGIQSPDGAHFQNGWVVIDSTGTHLMDGNPTGAGIVDLATWVYRIERTYDPQGQVVLDIVYRTGAWTYFDSAGAHPMGSQGLLSAPF